jgi:hypothetical protein
LNQFIATNASLLRFAYRYTISVLLLRKTSLMNIFGIITALALLSAPVTVWAKAPGPSLLGSWAVDVNQLPIPPEARPKSVTITFAALEGDKWSTTVTIVGGDGAARRMVSSYLRNGQAVAVEGDQDEGDKVAVSTPTTGILVLALSRQGVPGSTRVYAVAPEGRTMTETAVTYDESGAPRIQTNHFKRIGR